MDESSSIPREGLLISSVLGVKNSLRFRAHQSTLKAHAILRRVENSDNSDDEEEQQPSSYVLYKLVAQKRFTITPGKEILLTVEDDRFKDRAVLFSGIPLAPEDSPEETTEIPPLPKKSLPPKMRRAWTKKTDDTESPANLRASVGVQATIHTSSTASQVQPSVRTVSVQSEPSAISASVQMHNPTGVASTRASPPSLYINTATYGRNAKGKERSLSPMDLDSVSSDSTPSSPLTPITHSPTQSEHIPLDHEDDMQISPQITASLPSSPPSSFEATHYPLPAAKCEDRPSHFLSTQTISSTPSFQCIPSLTTSRTLNDSTEPEKASKKPSVHNPFVSAGFVTEFTGEAHTTNDPTAHDDVKPLDTVSAALNTSDPVNTLLGNYSDRTESISNAKSSSPLHRQSYMKVKEEPSPECPLRSQAKEPETLPTNPSDSPPMVPRKIKPIPTGPRIPPRAPRSFRMKDEETAPIPRTIAVIPSGSYSNPLGIKPSMPPSLPKTLQVVGTQNKKRVVIGVGSSFGKAMADTNLNLPVGAHQRQGSRTSELVSYSSPSPPPPSYTPPANSPTPGPPPPVLIKWKRLDANTNTYLNNNEGTLFERISPTNGNGASSNEPSSFSRILPFKTPPTSPTLTKKQSNGDVSELTQLPLLTASSAVPPMPDSQPTSPSLPEQNLNGSSSARSTISPSSMTRAPSIDVSKIPLVSMAFPAKPNSAPLTFHPLPQKPGPLVAQPVVRGIKRERPPSPPNFSDAAESTRKYKRVFRWPTLDSIHSIFLRGEGDLAIIGVAFSSDGTLLALSCADKTIRIWANQTRIEVARLSHNERVVNVFWIEGDTGIISLGDDGMISKWTRTGVNHWQWAAVVDIGRQPIQPEGGSGMCIAYHKDRIAVSLPALGVKVWFWNKGSWQLQRPIQRPNVTALTFIEDGTALLGGTADGVLWSCEIPNGTLRAYSFLKTRIHSIDINPAKTHALIACQAVSRLINLDAARKGQVEQSYSNVELDSQPLQPRNFGGCFTARGQGVLFGDVKGCALIWDTRRGSLVYGLDHGLIEGDHGEETSGETVTAAASMEASSGGCIVTGTKSGLLSWWSQPAHSNPDNKKPRSAQ